MIVGIDEVGRGCWAGPLVAGAVLLARPIPGLKDSKKLTREQREKLNVTIHSKALAIGLGWTTVEELDRYGMTKAIQLAMRRALEFITLPYEQIIIDGNYNFLSHHPKAEARIKADDLVPAVSAASIVAKVARDNFMRLAANEHPGYGFENHVGYGTAGHIKALQLKGVCSLHRRSFKPIQVLLA